MSEDVLSLLDQLSESSEQSVSVETARFAKAMEKYQSDAQAIQTTLQALYGQMSEQIESPRRTPSQRNATKQMVANLQERLDRLNDERRELSEQMNRIANMTDISSSPSKIRSPRYVSSAQISGLSPCEGDSEVEALRRENRALKEQLASERQRTRELRKGFSDAIQVMNRQYQRFAGTVSGVVKKNVAQMDDMTRKLMTAVVRDRTRNDVLHHMSSEIASDRAAIAETIDAFKADMFSAKFMALSSIRSQKNDDASLQESTPSRKSASSSRVLSPRAGDRRSQLLAMGFEALASSVMNNFGDGRSVRPLSEMLSDTGKFANYITEICQMQEKGIKRLNHELEETTTKLETANERLKSQSVSREVAQMVRRILESLKDVSDEMAAQHSELMSKLA